MQVKFKPNSHAFCWDHAGSGLMGAVSGVSKDTWSATMYALSHQELNGSEPSLLTIVAELDWQGAILECRTCITALFSLIDQNGAQRVPDDLRFYACQGEDTFAGGVFDIAVQTRGKNREYALWKQRFLSPWEWLGACDEQVQELAAQFKPPLRITKTSAITVSGAPINFLRLNARKEQISAAEADRFFVSL